MNCASLPPPLNPLNPMNPMNPPNLTADFHSNGEGKEEAASPHLLEERFTQAISESSRAPLARPSPRVQEWRGIHFSFTNFHLSMI